MKNNWRRGLLRRKEDARVERDHEQFACAEVGIEGFKYTYDYSQTATDSSTESELSNDNI